MFEFGTRPLALDDLMGLRSASDAGQRAKILADAVSACSEELAMTCLAEWLQCSAKSQSSASARRWASDSPLHRDLGNFRVLLPWHTRRSADSSCGRSRRIIKQRPVSFRPCSFLTCMPHFASRSLSLMKMSASYYCSCLAQELTRSAKYTVPPKAQDVLAQLGRGDRRLSFRVQNHCTTSA